MQINGIDRCLGCMQDKSGQGICPHCGHDEQRERSPAPALPAGTRLNDQYVLGRMLGHGGFGLTYLAWDERLDTRVAIKEYLPRDFSTRTVNAMTVSCFHGDAAELFHYGRRKFLEEARNLARFSDHPGIVRVLTYFEANATAYMVMQYIDGMDLKQYLAQVGGHLPVDLALRIMTPVLDALRAVHAKGLLHRDVSPDNIYLTARQQVMILDFGAARDAMGTHSQSQASIRKRGYSPEEQYRSSGEQGPWTDVYAAAATLYRMLTGRTPPDAMERLTDDRLQPPSRLGIAIGPEREAALMRALAVRAGDRLPDIRSLQWALTTVPPPPAPSRPPAQHPPPALQPPSPVPAPTGSAGRWLIPTLLTLSLLALFTIGWLLHHQSLQQTATAAMDAELRALADERERLEGERRARADALGRQAEEAERRRLEQAQIERERAASQAVQTIREYYTRLDRGDVAGAIGTWYSVSDRDALAEAMGRIADADILAIGSAQLAPDLSWAQVPVRVRVRNHGESAAVWAGAIQLKRWREGWEIDTMRGLEKQ